MKVVLGALLLLAAPAVRDETVRYDCAIDKRVAFSTEKDAYVTRDLTTNVGDDQWRYRIELKGESILITSDRDPAHISGKADAYKLSDGVTLAFTLKQESCLYSEQVCGSMVQLTDTGPSTAKLSITPTAFWSRSDKQDKNQFNRFLHVVLLASCSRKVV